MGNLPSESVSRSNSRSFSRSTSIIKRKAEGGLATNADGLGTVTIFECVDVAEAQHLADAFPLVKAGLIEFEYLPVGAFTPWEELFAHEQASTTDQISK